MTKLLLKSAFFLALLLWTSQLFIKPFVYHPFWGDPEYISKYDRFFESNDDFNTVFIGSSRTLRHVEPMLFDSITGLNSFNFGIDGVGCPFNYHLTKDILNSERSGYLDYIFLELFDSGGNLIEEIMHSNKAIYRYGWDDFDFTVKTILENQNLSLAAKSNEFFIHLRNLIESSYRFGQIHRIINSLDKQTRDKLGKSERGFINGDFEIAHNRDSFLINSRNELLLNPSLLEERKISNKSTGPNLPEVLAPSFQYHWSYVEQLRKNCEAKGIMLVLIVPPLMNDRHARFMKAFLTEAPKSLTLLNYSSSDRYPAYYQIENVFDQGHLNSKGSRIFTSTLAKDFNRLLKPTIK